MKYFVADMPPNGYLGGRVYLGQWAITKDMVVDSSEDLCMKSMINIEACQSTRQQVVNETRHV